MNASAIPTALRQRPQWVLWRYEERDGKPTKAPWQAEHPDRRASSTQADTWGTFEQAVAAADKADGIGYVFSINDPFVGLDLDGELAADDMQAIIDELASYTERSPSGNGYHIIVRAELPEGKGRHPVGIGVFSTGRYFTVTGEKVEGTPDSVEWRQGELDAILERHLAKKAASNGQVRYEPQPVDLDDVDLIEKARQARRGIDFDRLMRGDWNGYASQSEADLALCSKLAFWTGRDPERIDRIFRTSGLYRDKWERADYRTSTIDEAIAGCRDVYTAPIQKLEQTDAPAEIRADVLRFQPVRAFAAVDEPSAHPLLGNDEDTILPAGGTLMLYGDGGAGKTTLELDLLLHLATGQPWLGLPTPNPIKLAVIENEGPRGKFRQKLHTKLSAWNGADPADNMLILEDPWAAFSFTDRGHLAALAQWIEDNHIDLLAAGPLVAVGMKGGGTPDEVATFMTYITALRQELQRPLAVVFVHHTNKSGDVSGAWGGITDTLAHIQAQGNGRTRCYWRKVRWGSTLHEATWTLLWRDAESFDLEEKAEELPDSHYEDAVLSYINENPGCSWNMVEQNVAGSTPRKRKARDTLLSQYLAENRGTARNYVLWPSSPTSPHLALGLNAGDADNMGEATSTDGTLTMPPYTRPPKGGEVGMGEVEANNPDPDADIPF